MNTSNRYYDSSGGSDEIRPGRISSELREALNMAENDLPIWIYRMRALGYPPGWLNKAIVDTDDIFDTDTFSEGASNKRGHQEIQYDHSKLIEYPGFNTPMPSNCVDYHYYINMPPMLPHQQLEYAKQRMVSHMDAANSPKRARTSSPPHPEPSTSHINETHNKIPPEVIVISDDDDDDKDKTNPERSFSLINEKSDKECTADRVEPTGDKDNNLAGNEDSVINDSCKEAGTVSKEGKEESIANEREKSTIGDTKGEEKVKPFVPPKIDSPLTEGIKLVSRGTPMPKRVDRAPLEKFSQGVVGDLLYFENTPTSSGKFDSIKGLLNSIRKSKTDANSTNANSNKSF